MTNTITTKNYEEDIETLLNKADVIIGLRTAKIKYEIIMMYYDLGKMITEYKTENNSKYGDSVVSNFSKKLTLKYGRGFNITYIKYAVKFYEVFSNYSQMELTATQKGPPLDLFINATCSHII